MSEPQQADTPARALESALGASPPAAVTVLEDEVVADLAKVVHDARRRQQQDLTDALDHALRLVPRPLRRVVRKVVEG